MRRKDSYIYKILKEIHKGMKITSNPLEKLFDHCVEHKINMRNDKGCNPRSQLHNLVTERRNKYALVMLWSLLISIVTKSPPWWSISYPSFSCHTINCEWLFWWRRINRRRFTLWLSGCLILFLFMLGKFLQINCYLIQKLPRLKRRTKRKRSKKTRHSTT